MVQFLLFRQGTPWFRALCKGSLQPVLRNSVDAAYVAPCLLITKSSPPRESLRKKFLNHPLLHSEAICERPVAYPSTHDLKANYDDENKGPCEFKGTLL